MVGHAAEYERLVETLGRPTNPNALLVGEAGIGKETLVAAPRLRSRKRRCPESAFRQAPGGTRAFESCRRCAAPEELNARIKKIVDEIYAAGNVILYIPDIHNLGAHVGHGISFCGRRFDADYYGRCFSHRGRHVSARIQTGDRAAERFRRRVRNHPRERDHRSGSGKNSHIRKRDLEKQFHITISFGAIKRAVVLAKKYFRSKFLPSSAEEILKARSWTLHIARKKN
jgi:ATP-dependent Clp protease ATP-binding subunit ClpA